MPDIRPLNAADRTQWDVLWSGYLRFYRHSLSAEVTDCTFARLVRADQQPYAVVAVDGSRLLGFAHYLFHPSTFSTVDSCYLEDLFVAPAARGNGIGRALIHAVFAAADAAKASTVYWMTQEFNADGRALYDTLAHRTSFIKYER